MTATMTLATVLLAFWMGRALALRWNAPRVGASSLVRTPTSSHTELLRTSALGARASKRGEEAKEEQGEFVTIPYEGLVGFERGALFAKPLSLFDPVQDTDNLPGEDGSEEKIKAIQLRIKQRVEEMKLSGEWSRDVDEFGQDPLAKMPLWEVMLQQLRTCKPFESIDELALAYLLMLLTTVVLSAYLLVLRDSFDSLLSWYLQADLDSELTNEIYRAIN